MLEANPFEYVIVLYCWKAWAHHCPSLQLHLTCNFQGSAIFLARSGSRLPLPVINLPFAWPTQLPTEVSLCLSLSLSLSLTSLSLFTLSLPPSLSLSPSLSWEIPSEGPRLCIREAPAWQTPAGPAGAMKRYMYECVYITYVYIYIHIERERVYIDRYMCLYTCICIYIYIHIYIYTYISLSLYIYIHTYISIYLFIYLSLYMCIYIYIYTRGAGEVDADLPGLLQARPAGRLQNSIV